MRSVFGAVRDLGLIAASVFTWFLMVIRIEDGSEIFTVPVMGLYALGVLLSVPVVGNPTTGLGAVYSGAFRAIGLVGYVAGRFLTILWVLGFCMIIAVNGLDAPYALASVLWLPVYVGLPAAIALMTSTNAA